MNKKAQPVGLLSPEIMQRRFEELFHSLPYSIVLCSHDQAIVDSNRKASEQLGFEKQELVGLSFRDLLPEETRGLADDIFTRLLAQENTAFESALRKKNGQIFPVEIRSMLLENRDPQIVELIIRDVGESKVLEQEILQAYNQLEKLIAKRTEQLSHLNEELKSELIMRRKTEEELRRKKDELEAVNSKLKENQVLLVHIEKMATLGQMAASISHEINNPLAYIKSNLNSLYDEMKEMDLKDPQFVDALELVNDCRSGVNQVNEIIYSLKNFVRLERSDQQEADLNLGIESTLKVAWNQTKNRCEIKTDLEPLPIILCYPGQLNQVFMNLIINASQAMEVEGLIQVTSRYKDGEIRITFEDNGCGIPADKLEAIFDPFYTSKAEGEGTGLGLSICREIVISHGGTLSVESTLGRGTTFTVSIPVNKEGP